ncbi:MAG: hypothetical protein K2N44_11135 [Lachnospiraceae bacterium]|nr:hypothetical protein [Lachnospiraceae bacterium]
MNFRLENIKSAVKYDIEISGPAKTICNIPISHDKPTEAVMETGVLKQILEEAEKEEVLLINLVLNHFSDLFLDTVKILIEEINKTISQGVELSISFPIEDAEEFIANKEKLKEILLEQNIDISHYFLLPELFAQVGTDLGKFIKEMAFESIHDSKIHTLFPLDESTQTLFLKGIKDFFNATDIWKTYRLEFLNSYDLKDTKRYQTFIEKMNQQAEIIYSFLPTIPKEYLNEYDVLEDFEIRPGVCLGGSINAAYGLNGEKKICLQESDRSKMCYFDKKEDSHGCSID